MGFADQQDLAVPEDDASRVHFGGGVTGLVGEQAGDEFERLAGTGGHDLRCDLADGFVALAVERIVGKKETVLGDGLEVAGPLKPGGLDGWRRRHREKARLRTVNPKKIARPANFEYIRSVWVYRIFSSSPSCGTLLI